MTPVPFVKTMESYEVSLVTINQQTSNDSGIHRQDYRIKGDLQMDHMRFANRVAIRGVHFPKPTETGGLNYWTRLCGLCIAVFVFFVFFFFLDFI